VVVVRDRDQHASTALISIPAVSEPYHIFAMCTRCFGSVDQTSEEGSLPSRLFRHQQSPSLPCEDDHMMGRHYECRLCCNSEASGPCHFLTIARELLRCNGVRT